MEAPTGDMPVPTPGANRDWSELPLDALASVFGKLDAIEILMGAGHVCHSWLQATKLPDLWRSVDMERHKAVEDVGRLRVLVDGVVYPPKPKINGDVLCAMAKVAVDRSGGHLEVFVGKYFVTDELLKYIADRSPALKSVGLISCYGVSNSGFTELISKCPQMEDILLVYCNNICGRDVYEAAGRACAQLKRFTLRKGLDIEPSEEALGIAAMHELRSLTLHSSDVTNEEIASVLEGCPHLKHLDLSNCSKIVADDDALRARCARINSLTLPCNEKGDCYEDDDYYDAVQYQRDCAYDLLGDSD